MADKFYAVRIGKQPGIYRTWDECKFQVTGYKGAIYKKFDTYEQAQDFIKEVTPFADNVEFDKVKSDEMVAYVDGSYNVSTNEFGYGVVSFTESGKKVYSEKGTDPECNEFRNVSGEIYGALFAMNKAIEDGKKKLYLHFDYMGIAAWAKGDWKTNNHLTINYKAKFDKIKEELEVCFIKVKAHSGDIYNDEADKLAKAAIGVK